MPTYTYTGDPSTSSKDAVRFLCQDTQVSDTSIYHLADEEINYMLIQQSNVFMCAADACEVFGAYWAGKEDKQIGPLKLTRGAIFQRYQSMATMLRTQANRKSGATPIFFPVGENEYSVDGPYHLFWVGMDDVPGANGLMTWPPPYDMPPISTYP